MVASSLVIGKLDGVDRPAGLVVADADDLRDELVRDLWVREAYTPLIAERILGTGSMQELAQSEHPLIREYFYGPRGRGAREQAWNRK